jgi:hypothetical protein
MLISFNCCFGLFSPPPQAANANTMSANTPQTKMFFLISNSFAAFAAAILCIAAYAVKTKLTE